MNKTSPTGTLIALLALTGCPGDDVPADTDNGTSTGDSSGTTTATMTTAMPTSADTTEGVSSSDDGPDTDDESSSSSGTLPPAEPVEFVVTIENVSNTGLMFSPLSPGLWANHEPGADTLFETGVPDDGEGLEALAEDGDPTDLLAAVMGHGGVLQAGAFDTPVMAGAPGPLLPGDRYEFSFVAEPGTRLALGTMLVGSNDLVVASGPVGISLFAGGGQALSERDVSSSLRLWDAGTEVDQAPGQGPLQAVHGGSPNMGPSEDGGVFPFDYSTRAIPLGPDLIRVEVDDDPEAPGTFDITITNVSGDRGTLVTPLSPVLWALHTDAIALFGEGMPAIAELEALAEDGDAGPFDALLGGSAEVEAHAIVPGMGGPLMPGESAQLSITPSAAFPYLSLASMVVQSNDAFLAAGVVGDAPIAGIPLFDGGMLRDNQDIEADIRAHLTPWDAGTEANQVPGVGVDQAPRQGAANTGAPDPVTEVRRYVDVTNDLAGDDAGGFVSVAVSEGGGDYTITITNTSDTTVYPGVLTPVLWALHDDTVSLFELGVAASPGLEMLAEDGDASGLMGELMGMAGVVQSGVENLPTGGMAMPGPLFPGDSYEFTITPDATNRFLSFASMIVPSNDTFASLDPGGVALLDAMGAPRTPEAVAADISAQLRAWDAGTEGNQAGAAGGDMAPVGLPDTGPGNGNGLVREAEADPDAADDRVWSLPEAQDVIRVIVAPVER
ncbi:MAG: spondin domain-containing protein [Nannocystaceae bacterium]